MALAIKIQDQNHRDLGAFGDDPAETLAHLCAKAPREYLLRGIHPHADTMFNPYQLGIIIEEIDATNVEQPAERRALERLREAADMAIRKRGYLYFVGD
jgi:hypothetical protein